MIIEKEGVAIGNARQEWFHLRGKASFFRGQITLIERQGHHEWGKSLEGNPYE